MHMQGGIQRNWTCMHRYDELTLHHIECIFFAPSSAKYVCRILPADSFFTSAQDQEFAFYQSDPTFGCFPILDFLKAFLPKIELVILPGQSYHILLYFISFVFVASSVLWRMSTCSLFTVYVMQERKVVIPQFPMF